jgi:hypothetical protein
MRPGDEPVGPALAVGADVDQCAPSCTAAWASSGLRRCSFERAAARSCSTVVGASWGLAGERYFSGFAAVAFHVGTATDRDGVQYNLETDIRAYQGPYVETAGTKRFGTFAFI